MWVGGAAEWRCAQGRKTLEWRSERICLCRLHTHYNLGNHIRSLSLYTKLPLIIDTPLWLFCFFFPLPPAKTLRASTLFFLPLPPLYYYLLLPPHTKPPPPAAVSVGDCRPGAVAGVHTHIIMAAAACSTRQSSTHLPAVDSRAVKCFPFPVLEPLVSRFNMERMDD